MLQTLQEIRTYIQTLDSEKQIDGLILEDLIKFCDMRNHEPGTYYDFSAEFGIPEENVFEYVLTEARETTKKEFNQHIKKLIKQNLVIKVQTDDMIYYHLNIDLDNPFDYQIKAGLTRTIVNKLYGGST